MSFSYSEEFWKFARRSQSMAKIKAMVEAASTEREVVIAADQLDRHPHLLNATNCVVDLETGAALSHQRELLLTKSCAAAYDPTAQAPTFDAFLHRITGGDQELIAFIQRLLGYALTGYTGEQCMFVFHGVGANGKSTLLNLVRAILGAYATQMVTASLVAHDRGGGIPNDIAMLKGMRMIVAAETEEGQKLAASFIKQWTGGDAIRARFLFNEFFEFTPEGKIILATNYPPQVRGGDAALWRRLHMIPFSVVIPPKDRDPELPAKLLQETEGVLAWMVQGAVEWRRIGLCPPAVVTRYTDKLRLAADTVGRFVAEECERDAAARTNATLMLGRFDAWAVENDLSGFTSADLSKELERLGFEKRKSNGLKTWIGVRLRPLSS